jgi:hypothetical protein
MKRPLSTLVTSMLTAVLSATVAQAQQSPFGGVNGTIANGSTIQAENYDLGGEGVAYHDTTAGNTGGQHRADGVDIEVTTDTGGGYNVGWLIDGEWLEYTVNATAGTYTLTARVASGGAAVGDLRVVLDGVVLGTLAVNATGGFQTWADVSLPGIAITGGSGRVLRLEIVNGGDFNLNHVRFTSTGAGCAIGAACEAETALLGGGVVTSTLHAGYTGSGFADYAGNGTGFVEWTVNVSTAGTYNLNIRYANGGTGDRPMSIQVNGTTVLPSLSFPVTGWTTWTVRTQSVSLPAGSVRIRATELPNGPNVDNLVVTGGGATATATATSRATATATTRATATPTATSRPTATSTATTRATATATTGPGCAIGAPCEAETALLGGGVLTSTLHAGYTGTGFADYAGSGTGFVEWTVNVATAGTYNLNIRYANGGTGERPMSIQVNGTTIVSSLSFPVTGWTTWTVRTQSVSLPAGSVRIRATELPNGPNVDNLVVTSGGAPATATATTRTTATATATTRPTATPTATATTRVTATPTQGPSTNLALNKPITANSSTPPFVATNANDGNLTTYWESAGFPGILTVSLGANAVVDRIVIRLNPDAVWGPRSQTIQVLARGQSGGSLTTVVPATGYAFSPTAGGNSVTIPVSSTAADFQLNISTNTGAPGAQVAELEVWGVWAPNPDLVVTGMSWSPGAPSEVDAITLSATVQNIGTAGAGATTVDFMLGGEVVGSANVGALNAGASSAVSANIGTRGLGSHVVSSTVDPSNTILETNNANNTFTSPSNLVVSQAPGPDLRVTNITWTPTNPAAGAAVTFTVSVNNRGTTAVPAGSTTRVVAGATTISNTSTPSIAAGATVNVTVGTWTATAGGATVTATADATSTIAETNETNNSLSKSVVVGRGAAVPWVSYEAEAASHNGTLLVADPLRTFAHTNFATESSGRQSVRLNSTGQFVEFTSTHPANSIVVRNSIPDSAGGGGIQATISLYINGTFLQKITLSSRHSWLYGITDGTDALSNSPSPDARRLFDESHALLSTSYPSGTRWRLQRDSTDTASFYVIDFIDLEQVAPALSMPAGCTSITSYGAVPNDGLDDAAAIQRAVTDDENGVINCVWIPAGQWRQEQKILAPDPTRGIYNQKGIRNAVIRGAGMWHSVLYTTTEPQNVVGNINHPHEGNVGFDIDDNVQISDLAIFGLTTNRSYRGHGINGRLGLNTAISNVWIEHVNVGAWVGRDYADTPAYWNPGNNVQFTGMRIRNTFADGINFTNGTHHSTVFNSSFRNVGDDALAIWASKFVRDLAVDIGRNNTFLNNTIQIPWRANGIAIYGGRDNRAENNLIYDTMNYPGIMLATDHSPIPFAGTTVLANNGLYRCGGVFWGEVQKFGAITLFAPETDIVGVTIRDSEILDSTYDGIQFKGAGAAYPNVQITNVRIDKSNNGAGILAQGSARGNAVLSSVTITNSATGNIVIEPGSTFTITGQ